MLFNSLPTSNNEASRAYLPLFLNGSTDGALLKLIIISFGAEINDCEHILYTLLLSLNLGHTKYIQRPVT